MKKTLTVTIALFVMLALCFSAYAETDVTVNGQVRLRGEFDRRSFDSNNDHYQSMKYLRSRIGFKVNKDDNAYAFVQFQDSRVLGAAGQSATLNDNETVDLHQAYLKYKLWSEGERSFGVMGGRFEFNWGNQRLLGAVGWDNVGRSWEGGLMWYKTEQFKVMAANLIALERNWPTYNRDFNAYALGVDFNEFNLSLLALYENDADTNGYSDNLDIQALKRMTLMAYYTRVMDQIDLEFNFALQTGNMPAAFDVEYDISAMMFTGEVGYTFEGEREARVALGIDYTSGDDDFTDLDWKVFNNLYWTGHKFNGYMDYFTFGGPNGLVDLMLRGKYEFTEGWFFAGDLHLFSAAEDYISLVSGTPTATTDVGTEFDMSVNTTRVNGVDLKFGLSIFSAKDDFAGFSIDKQSGTWAYCQSMINF